MALSGSSNIADAQSYYSRSVSPNVINPSGKELNLHLLGIRAAWISEVITTEFRLAEVKIFQKPLPSEDVDNLVKRSGNFYGAHIPRARLPLHSKVFAHKMIIREATPSWFDTTIANGIEDAVVPGFSVFSEQALLTAVERISSAGVKPRVKLNFGASNEGQWPIDFDDIENLKAGYLPDGTPVASVIQDGIVIEENLENVKAFSLTRTRIKNLTADTYGIQSQTQLGGGALEYAGTISVPTQYASRVRGKVIYDPIYGQIELGLDNRVINAMRAYADAVADMEKKYGGMSTRINVDAISGNNSKGAFRCGAGDHSPRPGGASPAEIRTIADIKAGIYDGSYVYATRHIFSEREYMEYCNAAQSGQIDMEVIHAGEVPDWGKDFVAIAVVKFKVQ